MSTTITIRYEGVPDPVHPERAIPAPLPTDITVPQDVPGWVATNFGDCGCVPAEISVWTGPDDCGVSAAYSPRLGLDVSREVAGHLRAALPGEVPAWTAHLPAMHAAVVAALEDAERTRPDVRRACEANRALLHSIRDVEKATAHLWLDSETGEFHELPSAR
jgi:hypothetical protein